MAAPLVPSANASPEMLIVKHQLARELVLEKGPFKLCLRSKLPTGWPLGIAER